MTTMRTVSKQKNDVALESGLLANKKKRMQDLLIQAKKYLLSDEKITANILDTALAHLENLFHHELQEDCQSIFIDAYCFQAEIYFLKKQITLAKNAIREAHSLRNSYQPFLTMSKPFAAAKGLSAEDYVCIARLDALDAEVNLYESFSNKESISLLEKTIPIFEFYKAESELKSTYILLGIAFIKEQNYAQAECYFSKASALLPTKPHLLLIAGLGEIQRLAYQKSTEAEKHYQAVITLDAEDSNPLAFIMAKNGLGVIEFNNKNYPLACAHFSKLISLYTKPATHTDLEQKIGSSFLEEKNSFDNWAHIKRGFIYYAQAKHSAALNDFDYLFNAIHLGKELRGFSTSLQNAFICRAKMLTEVSELFEDELPTQTKIRLSKIVTDTSCVIEEKFIHESKIAQLDARTVRATANYQLGELELSLKDYNQLISAEVQCHHGRAAIYLAKKEIDLAIADYQTVLRYEPASHPDKFMARQQLCKIVQYFLTHHNPKAAEKTLNNMQFTEWPKEEMSYFYAHAYMVIHSMQQKEVSKVVEHYKKFKKLASNLDEFKTLKQSVDLMLVDFLKKLAKKTAHYDQFKEMGEALLQENPELKNTVTSCLLVVACNTRDFFKSMTHYNELMTANFSLQTEQYKCLLDMAQFYFASAHAENFQPFLEKVIYINLLIVDDYPDNGYTRTLLAEACHLLQGYKPKLLDATKINFEELAIAQYTIIAQNAFLEQDLKNQIKARGQRAILSYQLGKKDLQTLNDLLFVVEKDENCESTIPAYLSDVLCCQDKSHFEDAVHYASLAVEKTLPGSEERKAAHIFYRNAWQKANGTLQNNTLFAGSHLEEVKQDTSMVKKLGNSSIP